MRLSQLSHTSTFLSEEEVLMQGRVFSWASTRRMSSALPPLPAGWTTRSKSDAGRWDNSIQRTMVCQTTTRGQSKVCQTSSVEPRVSMRVCRLSLFFWCDLFLQDERASAKLSPSLPTGAKKQQHECEDVPRCY